MKSKNGVRSGKKTSSVGSKLLRGKNFSKNVKSVAASVLVNRKKQG